MGSILDYIDWRGDILFSERSFNEVDNLIFSELAYVNMDGLMADRNEIITIGELYRRYVKAENKSNIPLNDPFPLFKKAAVCDRFKSIRLTRYVDIIDLLSGELTELLQVGVRTAISAFYRKLRGKRLRYST